MSTLADAVAPHVASGAIPGLVAVVAKAAELDVTVLGDQALGGTPCVRTRGFGSRRPENRSPRWRQRFAVYVSQRILQPLGVIDTGFTFGTAPANPLTSAGWPVGDRTGVRARNPWNLPGRYGWVGGTGTSAHAVPADGGITILLTQVELGGPQDNDVLETFWTAAASEIGRNS